MYEKERRMSMRSKKKYVAANRRKERSKKEEGRIRKEHSRCTPPGCYE